MLNLTTLVAAFFVVSTVSPALAETNSQSDRTNKNLQVPSVVAINVETPVEKEKQRNCTGCNFNLPESPVYEMSPERRALLNTIRYAEGTWANGEDSGYRVLFGGRMVSSLDRHPDVVQYSSGYASAAAGAYQFMPGTWGEAAQRLSLKNFGPEAQDQAALYLIEKRGALHLADAGAMTPELANKLAPEWASFPTYSGSSYYGQPVRRFNELKRFYEENLSSLKQQAENETTGDDNV